MSNTLLSHEYKQWLTDLKNRIRSSQIKAALSVNSELISLYWDLGKMIAEKQAQSQWGSKLIEHLAKDLKSEFPDMGGFSRYNLYHIRQFYHFYSTAEFVEQLVLQNGQDFILQLGGKIPWGHHVLILKKIKDPSEAVFYIKETIANNWSRNILGIQIESGLYRRQGKAVSNFSVTLPKPQSDLAVQTLKDPYIFDFLTIEKNVQELELERRLVGYSRNH